MDTSLIGTETAIITALAVAYLLLLLMRGLGRSRPGFSLTKPLAVGYVLRLLVIAGISVTGLGQSIRGGDEIGFLTQAHQLAHLPFTSGLWLPTNHQSFLHVIVFALQLKVLGSSEGALRITQVGISLAGVILIVTAVYDLSGPRAARLAAWLLSLEPASLMFNEVLHKEPLMELASGLVVYGAGCVWKKLSLKGVVLMTLGGLIALATRRYVGWFFFACEVVVIFHAAIRQLDTGLRSLPAIYGVVAAVAIATPAILTATSTQSLQRNLQSAQNANATSTKGNGSANGNNLALEQVNFSSRSGIVTNLPKRIRDILLRPYPWQAGDSSQAIGVVGSLVAFACFFLLIRYAWLLRGQVFQRAGPLLYPFFFLMIAYALAVGNAGTGYRYRTHLVTLALAAMVILRAAVLERRAAAIGELGDQGAKPDERRRPALSATFS